MSRFRFTAGESAGMAVLLLCVALPIAVRMCAAGEAGTTAEAEAARAAADSAAQARIDSMQQRDDSLRAARDSLRATRKKTSKNRFIPDRRDRLDDIIEQSQK